MGQFLKDVGIKFKRVGNGEYLMKSRLPSTRSHRRRFIPFVEFLARQKKVVMLTHDECNMTVNLSQAKALVADEDEAKDTRQKSGAGLGN